MRVSVIQPDTVWEDKLRNLEILGKMISGISGTDIVVLPEMFTTGFSMSPDKLSEKPYSVTYEWMVNMSEAGRFAVCGSYIVCENDRYFNRWIFVTPDRQSWHYDKRHLFRMEDEEKAYSPGQKRIIIEFRGVRILPAICYDLRFPVWSRNRNDYDLMINSANWPEPRQDVWLTLLKARAIENQCYVAASNRVGTDPKGISYYGDSMIISPYGQIIASVKGNKEGYVTAEISMEKLMDFRRKFPVALDADKFMISDQ